MTDVQQPPSQQPWQAVPPPQQPQPSQPEPPKTNGSAVAGFVIALIGFFGSLAHSGVAVAALLCLVGLGLSVRGVVVAREHRTGRGLAIAGIVIACLALISCLGASSSRSSSSMTSSAPSYSAPSYTPSAPQSLPAGTYTGGTYVVGSDIQAGTYSTQGIANTGSILCGWWRLKDTTGDSSAIITGGNADGPTTITIKPSDGAIEFQGNCQWTQR